MQKFYLPIFIIIAVAAAGLIYYAVISWVPSGEAPVKTKLQPITREKTIKDISEKINELSPVKPVLGGKWYVNRFWFIQESNKDFYVEYEDGHIMSRLLIETEKVGQGLTYKIIGVFEPGEVDWKLMEGEDKFFGQSLDLYEYSNELEMWVKKN